MLTVSEMQIHLSNKTDAIIIGHEKTSSNVFTTFAAASALRLTGMWFNQTDNSATDLFALAEQNGDECFYGDDPNEQIVFVFANGESLDDESKAIIVELASQRSVRGCWITNLHSVVIIHDSKTPVDEKLVQEFLVIGE